MKLIDREIINEVLVHEGYQVQCKCGTKTIMTKAERAICRGCGHWVYKNKKAEFKDKLKENLCKKK